jgi:hypothetical protein
MEGTSMSKLCLAIALALGSISVPAQSRLAESPILPTGTDSTLFDTDNWFMQAAGPAVGEQTLPGLNDIAQPEPPARTVGFWQFPP